MTVKAVVKIISGRAKSLGCLYKIQMMKIPMIFQSDLMVNSIAIIKNMYSIGTIFVRRLVDSISLISMSPIDKVNNTLFSPYMG